MRKTLSFFVALWLLAAAGPGHAQVYKWVDSDGVTHYSQQPPEAGAAKEIPIPKPAVAPAPAPAADPASTPSATADSENGAADKRAEQLSEEIRARRAAEDQQQADLDKQRAEACQSWRDNLATLQSHGRVRVQENGETRVLSPQEQAQQIIELEKQIQENCS